MKGTESTQVGNITINCMGEEARDLLDTIMEQWREIHPDQAEEDHYQFAYWLVRYSDLIEPKRGV